MSSMDPKDIALIEKARSVVHQRNETKPVAPAAERNHEVATNRRLGMVLGKE